LSPTQTPLAQWEEPGHWSWLAQPVAQAAPSAAQPKGVQVVVVGTQLPLPPQAWVVSQPSAQVGVPQGVSLPGQAAQWERV
jgi:hypothetical protein